MTLVIELTPHVDAGDRTRWTGDQDDRPLSPLGERQARALAAALGSEPVDALYSSPALRCLDTLGPIADSFGLYINVFLELREARGFSEPAAWVAEASAPAGASLGGAHAAGRAWAALQTIIERHAAGRVIVCSHGDLIPATVAFLIGAHGLATPPALKGRGSWFTLRFEGRALTVERHQPPSGFPT